MTGIENPYTSPQASHTLAEPPQQRPLSAALRRVATGLNLIFYGIIFTLAGFLITNLINRLFAVFLLREIYFTIHYGCLLAFIIGGVLLLVGSLFCLDTPSESEGKGYLITAILFQLLSIPVGVSGVIDYLDQPLPAGLTILLNTAAGIFFLLFLRQLSRHLDRQGLVYRATITIRCCTVMLLFNFSYAFLFGYFLPLPAIVLVRFGQFVFSMILLMMSTNIVIDLRKVLT